MLNVHSSSKFSGVIGFGAELELNDLKRNWKKGIEKKEELELNQQELEWNLIRIAVKLERI